MRIDLKFSPCDSPLKIHKNSESKLVGVGVDEVQNSKAFSDHLLNNMGFNARALASWSHPTSPYHSLIHPFHCLFISNIAQNKTTKKNYIYTNINNRSNIQKR